MEGITIKVHKCATCGKAPIVGPSAIGCNTCNIFFLTVDSQGMKMVADNWNKMQMGKVKKTKFQELSVGDLFELNQMNWMKIRPIPTYETDYKFEDKNAVCLEHPYQSVSVSQERKVIRKGNVQTLTRSIK